MDSSSVLSQLFSSGALISGNQQPPVCMHNSNLHSNSIYLQNPQFLRQSSTHVNGNGNFSSYQQSLNFVGPLSNEPVQNARHFYHNSNSTLSAALNNVTSNSNLQSNASVIQYPAPDKYVDHLRFGSFVVASKKKPLSGTSKTNLYISGLSEEATDDGVLQLVKDVISPKSCKALRQELKCTGTGFIDCKNEEDAKRALEHITMLIHHAETNRLASETSGYQSKDDHGINSESSATNGQQSEFNNCGDSQNSTNTAEEFSISSISPSKSRYYSQLIYNIVKEGRMLEVKYAYENEKDPFNIYVRNLPKDNFTEEKLKNVFSSFGNVVSVKLLEVQNGVGLTGAGFVRFNSAEECKNAIEIVNSSQIKLIGADACLRCKLADKADRRSSRSTSSGANALTDPPAAHMESSSRVTAFNPLAHRQQANVMRANPIATNGVGPSVIGSGLMPGNGVAPAAFPQPAYINMDGLVANPFYLQALAQNSAALMYAGMAPALGASAPIPPSSNTPATQLISMAQLQQLAMLQQQQQQQRANALVLAQQQQHSIENLALQLQQQLYLPSTPQGQAPTTLRPPQPMHQQSIAALFAQPPHGTASVIALPTQHGAGLVYPAAPVSGVYLTPYQPHHHLGNPPNNDAAAFLPGLNMGAPPTPNNSVRH